MKNLLASEAWIPRRDETHSTSIGPWGYLGTAAVVFAFFALVIAAMNGAPTPQLPACNCG